MLGLEADMFRLPFAKRADIPDAAELRDADEMWSLPDMEPAPPSQEGDAERLEFHLDLTPLHPVGTHPARLCSWRPLPNDRAGWVFRTDGTPEGSYLEFVTDTVFRANNTLCRLLTALDAVPDYQESLPADPEVQSDLRKRLARLDPDRFVGRWCRIEVAHEADDLGNVLARVKNVVPMLQD